MKKALAIVLIIFVIILILVYMRKTEAEVCFKNKCFKVELAVTPEEKARGLMYRESMDSSRGMLFVYDKEGDYGFWMKNTKIPLDIIWINKDSEVTYISRDTKPCVTSDCPTIKGFGKYVLEVNSGLAKDLNAGDKVEIHE